MLTADPSQHRAIHDLYSQHHGWLQGWLRGRLGDCMDSEDLAQDTFVRVLRSPQDISRLQEPRRFLVTVAKGLTIDLFRRRSLERQYQEVLAALPEPQWPSEEERAIALETLIELDTMLAGLGTKVREAFILSQLEGLTYPQIAEVLDVSLRTVKNYMAKAMEHCCLYRLEQSG
ncbi:RNA polymerase sigma factor [Nitrincola sp. A-D6]|uniref:sigma-70 family RNA polymerase sigma factor n=1 Tax=Nitrincola sp. A-D6 TaxID=1545442 RepID=UPI00051FCF38|nr:sigma-70 family RNA polymerase sigma factor [Nitrincola sp. A-D6]KGK40898.1 RNA polymerase sigma factor [Nitrincola sp. A-D6]